MKIIGNRVLIKKIEKEETGFELATLKEKDLTEGEVVGVGENSPVNIGDIIIIPSYAGDEYEGDKFVDYKYILAVK